MSGNVVAGVSGRNIINAARKLINKWDLTTTSGFLTVFQEDDTTEAYRQAASTVSGAEPLTSLDTQ